MLGKLFVKNIDFLTQIAYYAPTWNERDSIDSVGKEDTFDTHSSQQQCWSTI